MPGKGKFTAADAMKNGQIPAAPVGRVVNRWCFENRWMDDHTCEGAKQKQGEAGAAASLAAFTGVSVDLIIRLRRGGKEWIEFDNADRIVTFIDPFLWYRDPELREVYGGFDFAWLDLARPTCPEADPLSSLGFLSNRLAAAVLGVSDTAVFNNRRKRAAVAA